MVTDEQRRAVEDGIAIIKAEMPNTLRKIEAAGPGARALVRRALRGEPNCFWACERGHVVGTPFAIDHPLTPQVALTMVTYGCEYVCMLALVGQEASHGQG